MITVALTGQDKVWDNLTGLARDIRDTIMKRAMARTVRPIVATAKQLVPVDNGTLRDSIISIITTRGSKGETVRAIIGPRTNIKVPLRLVSRGPRKGTLLIAIPTRYAHLVEYGHAIVINGTTLGHVAPVGFMRAAWDEYGGEAAVYTFADEMQAGIAGAVLRNAITASRSP